MEGQASNDYGDDTPNDQNGGSGETARQKPHASCDEITDNLNKTLDRMLAVADFTLADILGALRTMTIQVEEQILFQYRINLSAAQAANQQPPQ